MLVSRKTVKIQQRFKTREVKGRKRQTGRRAKEEERTERSLTHREDSAASLIGGPRCTVGASGTAFVWILGRLSCLIRYGLEIRPPRADSGKGTPRTKLGNGPTLRLCCISLPFILTPPNSLISLSLSLSLAPSLPPSLPPCLPPCLPASLPPSLSLSLSRVFFPPFYFDS